MAKITLKTNFYGGDGSVIMDGEGIPKNTTISSGDADTAITVTQTDQDQGVTVSGVIPAGDAADTGKITITVTDESGTVLSPASDNTFEPTDDGSGGKKYTFTGFVTYEL